jgi:superfamily II RNA helicase
MVKICSLVYHSENGESFNEYYKKFNYELHDFQKWSIDGVVNGHHVLVTAPTGTGKSMPAEFAIDFFHSKGKKSIYCSPIKSLSNQKFYDFTQKYPHISVGLITGDIKTNSTADVLIMTTEILLNKLYQLKSKSEKINSSTSFEMDIENDLGCVIFDEIHMINDKDRGHVWENCIMMLPGHIQMIGLSATLDQPEKFAEWLETRGSKENISEKIVYLAKKLDRPVPLTHYSFITANTGIFKSIKDKSVHEEIRKIIDKPFIIQTAKGEFNENHYSNMNKMLNLFEKNDVRVKRQHVLNQVSKHLVEQEMLPALCYVFSRKQLEKCANELTTPLLEFDSKVPYTIRRECEQIIRKLPNFQEYLHLPEYINLVSLLEKGVGIHHAGMMSILREIVEILFAKGMIKMLFCTTSVAIGLNLPVKTAIFTDIYKHDGDNLTMLQGHEYTQAAGRAGRLGLDSVGHVIHLNNLFRNVESISYKIMLKGKPQTLTSKFKISFNLLLNLIDIGDNNFINFAKKSMIKGNIDSQSSEIQKNIENIEIEYNKIEESIKHLRTPVETINEYILCIEKRPTMVNKKRKEIDRQIQHILDNYKFIETEKSTLIKYNEIQTKLHTLQKENDNIKKYIDNNVLIIVDLLEKDGFLSEATESNNVESEATESEATESGETKYILTHKGHIATHLREIHCLVFADLVDKQIINDLTSRELVSIFSCFTNVSVQDELKSLLPKSNNKTIQDVIIKIKEMYNEYQEKELLKNINTGTDYNIHFDLLNYVINWCDCNSIEECKFLLQTLEKEKGIFLGEFVKALLKINNISCEMEKVAELTGNIQFLSKLKEIPTMTLKYVVTNQSLYV